MWYGSRVDDEDMRMSDFLKIDSTRHVESVPIIIFILSLSIKSLIIIIIIIIIIERCSATTTTTTMTTNSTTLLLV